MAEGGGGGDPRADGARLLLAVEQVAADVDALASAVAAGPPGMAARADVDEAAAGVARRVDALGGALVQLRLSLVAAVDRAGERLDQPPWLPELQRALQQGSQDGARRAGLSTRGPSPVELAPPPWLAGLRQTIDTLGARLEIAVKELTGRQPPTSGPADPRWLAELHHTLETAFDAAVVELAGRAAPGPAATPPPWLPDLQHAIAELSHRLDRAVGEPTRGPDATPPWLPELRHSVDTLGTRIRDAATELTRQAADRAIPLDELNERLAAVELSSRTVAEDARRLVERVVPLPDRLGDLAGLIDPLAPLPERLGTLAAHVERLEDLPDRIGAVTTQIARLEDLPERFGAIATQLDRLGPLPERLGAVAAQLDRLTPLARLAADTPSLVAQLARLDAGVKAINAHLGRPPAGPAPGAPSGDGDGDTGSSTVLELLAGMARSQEELSATSAAILEQVHGPMGILSVLARMGQRERSLADRLDRFEAELHEPRPRDPAPQWAAPGAGGVLGDHVVAAVRQAVEQQDQALAARLEDFAVVIRTVAALAPAAPPDPVLEVLVHRLDRQERSSAAQLQWISGQLAQLAQAIPTAQLAADTGRRSATDDRLDAILGGLTALARRQDELAVRVSELTSQIPPPPDPGVSAEAAHRLEELRAERVRVQLRLREERRLAAHTWEDPDDDFGGLVDGSS